LWLAAYRRSEPIEQNVDHGTARKPLILGPNPQVLAAFFAVSGEIFPNALTVCCPLIDIFFIYLILLQF
jgi:hypothetical protein